MNSENSRIYFNEVQLRSDLSGAVQGSLLFAQAAVIPSRASMLPGDTQPRLVALRNTLVMFKPFGSEPGYTLTVRLEGQAGEHTIELSPPDKLPRPAGQVEEVLESDLTDSGQYDYVISTQAAIDSVANDRGSRELHRLLNAHATICIKVANGRWARDFYLPEYPSIPRWRKIVFHSSANFETLVHYHGSTTSVKHGQTVVLYLRNRHWGGLEDISYSTIRYGADFWSGVIPWDRVRPGLKLSITAANGVGTSPVIDVGAPTEMLLNTIDLGMLLPNREVFTAHFDKEHHRQYFQQLPCSRLIVNQYEPVHWREVMMPDGTLYKTQSSDTGDVHNGDMRQRIGKELVSLGINNANYGIHSSPGSGEDNLNKHFVAAGITAHSAIGKYANGDVIHGLSGGGSIVTLENYVGNEFSHELGHNFGIGHYPGEFNGSVHRPANAVNSAWGWDSDRNAFLPNFEKARSGKETCYEGQCQPPFHGRSFNTDTMAGGYPVYSYFNGYTLHTPYVNQLIQRYLEEKVVFDPASRTGYLKWDQGKKAMQEWGEFHEAAITELDLASMTRLVREYRLVEVSIFNSHWMPDVHIPPANAGNQSHAVYVVHEAIYNSMLHINGTEVLLSAGTMLRYQSNGVIWVRVDDVPFNVARKPVQQGTPVTTLLGYYDPERVLPSYLYPALYGAYGNVFHADRPVEILAARCYLAVHNSRGERMNFLLRSQREAAGLMNRFHVNVPTAFNATVAEIVLHRSSAALIQLSPPKGTSRHTIHGRT